MWINATGLTKDMSKHRPRTENEDDCKKCSGMKGHYNLSESWADGHTSVKEMVASESRNR